MISQISQNVYGKKGENMEILLHQTTLRIEPELYKWLKLQAVISDVSTNDLIRQILNDYKQKKED